MSLTPTGIYARAFAVAGRPNQMNAFQLHRSNIPTIKWLWKEDKGPTSYPFVKLPLILLEPDLNLRVVSRPSRRLTAQHVRVLIDKRALSNDLLTELTAALLRGEIPDEAALLPGKCPVCEHPNDRHDSLGCEICACEEPR